MKRSLVILIVVFVAVLLFANWGCGTYNGLVTQEEEVTSAWAQVQNVYQRRADLIPNLVSTVQGAADFERGTLTDVINARAKATGITVDSSVLNDPAKFQQFQQAQGELGGALSRLLVAVEKYPDLKANANFMELQSQLEGTENRIAVERKNFNEAVNDYNSYIRRFPTNLITGIFGFSPKGYFQSTPGSERPPEVKF